MNQTWVGRGGAGAQVARRSVFPPFIAADRSPIELGEPIVSPFKQRGKYEEGVKLDPYQVCLRAPSDPDLSGLAPAMGLG